MSQPYRFVSRKRTTPPLPTRTVGLLPFEDNTLGTFVQDVYSF